MQDEHFMRDWNALHEHFTAELSAVRKRPGHFRAARAGESGSIGSAYDSRTVAEPRPALSPAAKASLRGLAASVITVALWASVMLIATPTPGFASPVGQASVCAASPVLA